MTSFKYKNIAADAVVIDSCKCDEPVLVIPEEIDGKKVTRLGPRFCNKNNNIIEARVPNNVKTIASWAFDNCSNLKKVTLGIRTEDIDVTAFDNCNQLEEFAVNESNLFIKSIDGVIFSRDGKDLIMAPKSLSGKYKIPDGVKTIQLAAFSDCKNLKEIIMPDTVEIINNFAFENCKNLIHIHLSKNLQEILVGAFEYCPSIKHIVIPDGLKRIGEVAFKGCRTLDNVIIPDSIKKLDAECFADCTSLQNIKLPENLKTIEGDAFRNCTSLYSLTIPDKVQTIGVNILAETKFHDNICNWKNGMLYCGRHLLEVDRDYTGECTILKNTYTIADYAFWSCASISSIKFPTSIKHISPRAFDEYEGARIIKCANNKYVQKWAKDHDFEFLNNKSRLSELIDNFQQEDIKSR